MKGEAPLNSLQLSSDEMRRLGYGVIDAVVEHWSTLRDKPAVRISSREVLEAVLREPLPLEPLSPDAAIQIVLDRVFPSIGHLNHPRFFGFIPTPSNYIGVLADLLTSGFTPFCGTWLEGSGPAEIELVTLDWLKGLFGFPAQAGEYSPVVDRLRILPRSLQCEARKLRRTAWSTCRIKRTRQ